MFKLPLAIDIAEITAKADTCPEPLDVETIARRLKDEHPEVDVSQKEIAESLRATSRTPTY